MSTEGRILWRQEDGIGIALIDRPARRNSLNALLCHELQDHLRSGRGLKVLVVGGAGNQAFCSGADLNDRDGDSGGLRGGGGDTFRPAFEELLDEIVYHPAPVIAAVNGPALGAGMQLAVACDLRVAAPTATFGIPAARLGVVVSAINVERLVRTVGEPLAKDILLTARVLSASEAVKAGFVQRTAEDALAAACQLAEDVARLAPLSVRGHKETLNGISRVAALSEADLDVFRTKESQAFASQDFREGLSAFREKRAPRFSGS